MIRLAAIALIAAFAMSACIADPASVASPSSFESSIDASNDPSSGAIARADSSSLDTAVPPPGTLFAVSYDPAESRWRAAPVDGPARVWRAKDLGCASAPIPSGFWIVTRAEDGSPELVAPSATALPNGYPERIAVKPCGEGGLDVAHAPRAVLELLADAAGVVHVDD